MTIDERASRSMSLSPSPRFGLNWQMEFMTELCSELNHGVVFGVGGHTECWGDGMCSEMRGGDIPSERVVKKGVPLQSPSFWIQARHLAWDSNQTNDDHM